MGRSFAERYEDILDKAREMLENGEEIEVRVRYEVWQAAREDRMDELYPEPTLATMIASLIIDEENADRAKRNSQAYRINRFNEIKTSIESLPRPEVQPVVSAIQSTSVESPVSRQVEVSAAIEQSLSNMRTLPQVTTEVVRRPEPPRRDANEVEVFTHDRIRIDCPYPIQSLLELSIVRELNEHGRLTVSGIVSADHGEDLIERQSEDAPIEVYGQGLEEEVLLFSGRITQVEIQHMNQVYTIVIEGMSATNSLDDKFRTRSFQNQEMTFTELIDDLLLKNHARNHVINTTENTAIGKMKLQYEETDWEFIRRLATHFNTVLVADISYHEIPRFWFGLPELRGKLTDVVSYSMFSDQVGFMEAQGSGLHVRESDFVKYRVVSRDVLGLGEKVEFRGEELRVVHVEMVLQNSVLCYTYIIGHERGCLVPMCPNDRLQGVSMLGEVLETRDQEVRVHFRCDESQNPNEAQWIPYTPESNHLMYSMPEPGTLMSICMGNRD